MNQSNLSLILNLFDVKTDNHLLNPSSQESYEKLRVKVDQAILFLINTNLEKLLQILYRIDISEENVEKAFLLSRPQEISKCLSKLVIERELKKIHSRQFFKKEE